MHALILAPFSETQLTRLRTVMDVTYENWMESRRLHDPDELADKLNRFKSKLVVVESDFVFEETFNQTSCLKFVGICRAATNQIDMDIATSNGVLVVNTPTRNANAVAEHTLGLMFALARRIPHIHQYIKKGNWQNPMEPYVSMRGIELSGRTLGIIGLGAIGRRLAELGHAISMEVIGYDPYANGIPNYVKLRELDLLLTSSDFVSVHVASTPETENLLNAERLSRMKPSAFLTSTSDASVIDQKALVKMLQKRETAGAAFDVFETHPISPQNPLLTLDNVILSPHLGGATAETIERHSAMMTDDIFRYLEGKPPLNLVNPEAWKDRE